MGSLVIWTGVRLQQTYGTYDFLGTCDELLKANLFREGAKGEAHQLGKIKDGNSITGFISFLNLLLAAVEVRLAERTRDRDRIRPRPPLPHEEYRLTA